MASFWVAINLVQLIELYLSLWCLDLSLLCRCQAVVVTRTVEDEVTTVVGQWFDCA